MSQAGITWQAFERVKPCMAGITLAISPWGKLGYEANLGAEKTLTATAKSEGKAIGALETLEQQLGYFNDLPEEQQIAFLNAKVRSDEHKSELQSLMSNSYAVFCLKKITHTNTQRQHR